MGFMSETKETLRREAIRHRDRMVPGGEDAEAACALFFEAVAPAAGQIVALYWPKGREFDTSPIIERLLAEGVACALPVVAKGDPEMKFVRFDETVPLAEGPFGIMQPVSGERVEPDVVVVPLLAFDRKGYRLGYGGGYYDRALRALRERKDVLAVGLAYAEQAVLFNLPVEEHDEKLDRVITPQKAHCFPKTSSPPSDAKRAQSGDME